MSVRQTIIGNLKTAIEAMTVANGYTLTVKAPVLLDMPHSDDLVFDESACVVAINDVGPDRVIGYFEGSKVLASMNLTVRGFVHAHRTAEPGVSVSNGIGSFVADFKDLLQAIKGGSPSLGANFRFLTWENIENQLVEDTQGHVDFTLEIRYWYTRGSA
jgi:hypothetical protein